MIREIEVDLNFRNITRLCHFTNYKIVPQILSSDTGVLASSFLDKDIYPPNDELRADGKIDYICCSIQYPNTWYLRRIQDKDSLFNEWVILYINPQLMCEESALFSPTNAATNRGANITAGYEGYKTLFKNEVISPYRTIYRKTQVRKCCSTDDQAEVLVFRNIRRCDIIGMAVNTLNQAQRLKVICKFLHSPNIPIFIAPDLFCRNWSDLKQQGRIPQETLYESDN